MVAPKYFFGIWIISKINEFRSVPLHFMLYFLKRNNKSGEEKIIPEQLILELYQFISLLYKS